MARPFLTTPILAVLALFIAGCPDTNPTVGRLILNTDANSQHAARMILPDGTEYDFWLRRDADGDPDYVSDVRMNLRDGTELYVQFDAIGRPTFIRHPNGGSIRVHFLLEGNQADVTLTRPDGRSVRGIMELPTGLPGDSPGAKTVHSWSKSAMPKFLNHAQASSPDVCALLRGGLGVAEIWEGVVSFVGLAGCVASIGGDFVLFGPTGEALLGCAASFVLGEIVSVAIFTTAEAIVNLPCGSPERSALGEPEAPVAPSVPERDADGDGYSVNEGDCDDTNPNIHPYAPEDCDDATDLDCDGDYTDRNPGCPIEPAGCQNNATCDDSNVCTDDECVGGQCTHRNNSSPCNDGLFCTLNDVCSGGVCIGTGERCPGQTCDEDNDICPRPGPDLVIDRIVFIGGGQTITVRHGQSAALDATTNYSWTIYTKNIGAGSAGSSYTHGGWKNGASDCAVLPVQTFLGNVSVPTLIAGAEYGGGGSWLWGTDYVGTYSLVARADRDSAVNEGTTGETNNDFCAMLNVTGGIVAADLVVSNTASDWNGDYVLPPSTTLNVMYTIANQGDKVAEPSSVGVYLSTNANNLDVQSAYFINNDLNSSIPAGGVYSDTVSISYQAGSAPPDGAYYVWLNADDDGQVNEGNNEGNNTKRVEAARVVIESIHVVTMPATPSGPTTRSIGQSGTYCTSGSTCSLGHPVEYRFVWQPFVFSSWSTATCAPNSWSQAGTYYVKGQARCQVAPEITSMFSGSLVVNVP